MKTFRLPALIALALSTALATACATVEEDPADTASDSAEVTIRPKVELFKDTAGQYRFNFLASNGQVLVSSQAYSGRTVALNGMLSVLDNGQYVGQYDVKAATGGGAYFNILAANRAVIATSEVYETESGARAGVDATMNAIAAYYEHWDTDTGARFDVFQGADLRFYFDLRAKNGAIILQSQGYSGEAAALNGALSVKDNGVIASRYVILQNVDGRWYFNLKASNGQVIATSQMYSSKYNAQRGRDAMIALLPLVELL